MYDALWTKTKTQSSFQVIPRHPPGSKRVKRCSCELKWNWGSSFWISCSPFSSHTCCPSRDTNSSSGESQWMWHHNMVGVSWLQQQSKLAKTCQSIEVQLLLNIAHDWSKQTHDKESVTCSFAAPIKSRDPALVSLLTESKCVANNDDNRGSRDIVTTRSPELDNSLSKTRWQLQQDHSELSYSQHITHISKSLMYTHENSTGQKVQGCGVHMISDEEA